MSGDALAHLRAAIAAADALGDRRDDELDAAMAACGLPVHETTQPDGSLIQPLRRRIPLASELDPTQRAAAALWAEAGSVPCSYPMPSTPTTLRRWLGLAPPGALFTETADGTLFHRLRALDDREDMGEGEAWLEALPIGDRLDALFEIVLSPGDFSPMLSASNLLLAASLEVGPGHGAWAVAAGERLLAMTSFREPSLARAVFAALVASGRLEPRFERLLVIDRWTDAKAMEPWVRAIPEERREAVILAALADASPADACGTAVKLLPAFPLAGLARLALAHLASTSRPREHLATIEEVARRAPEVRAALDEHERAHASLELPLVTALSAARAKASAMPETTSRARAQATASPKKSAAKPEKRSR